MTDAPAEPVTATTDADEQGLILAALLAERDLSGRASITEIAICNQVARLLADPNGTERTAQSVASLLALLPPPVRRIERPAEGEWDMSKLSNFQVLLLEEITEVATGARRSNDGERMTHALELVRALDRAGDMELVERLPECSREEMRARIVSLTNLLFRPFLPSAILHNPYPPDSEVAGLRARIAELEAMLSVQPPRLPPPLSAAERHALAVAAAPIMHGGSGIDALSRMVDGRGPSDFGWLGT